MRIKVFLQLFIVVCTCGLLIISQVDAQSTGSLYIVTASQAINARQCPRLDCGIVRSLAPETVVNVVGIVSGDTVLGSDQWVQIDDDGVQMYAHSSLVTPDDAEPLTDSEAAPATDIESVDTSSWGSFEVGQVQFRAPRGWVDLAELASDADFLDGVEETYGKESRQWYEQSYQMIEDHVYDMVLVELDNAGVLYISHGDWEDVNISARYLRRLLETSLSSYGESELVSSEVIATPMGEAVRIEAVVERADGQHNRDFLYGVICDNNEVYILSLVVFNDWDRDWYADVAQGIVSSFEHSSSDL